MPFLGIYLRERKESVVSQSCLTLCDTMVYSPSGSSVHGIHQARILEWVAIPFSRRLPDPEIEPMSLALQADFYHLSTGEALGIYLKKFQIYIYTKNSTQIFITPLFKISKTWKQPGCSSG